MHIHIYIYIICTYIFIYIYIYIQTSYSFHMFPPHNSHPKFHQVASPASGSVPSPPALWRCGRVPWRCRRRAWRSTASRGNGSAGPAGPGATGGTGKSPWRCGVRTRKAWWKVGKLGGNCFTWFLDAKSWNMLLNYVVMGSEGRTRSTRTTVNWSSFADNDWSLAATIDNLYVSQCGYATTT